jgi:galactokinase
MMPALHTQQEMLNALHRGALDAGLRALYAPDSDSGHTAAAARIRLENLLHEHLHRYGPRPVGIFSAPGRTELAGNHTDHNRGVVVAAAVTLDCLAVASARADLRVHLVSAGFARPVDLTLDDLQPRADEKETPAAIVRGMAAGIHGLMPLCGFDACVHSTVPVGAGLSSSAAFEVLCGRIFSGWHSGYVLTQQTLAALAHTAESRYFGKPCGEMDQLACAGSGASVIRFGMPQGKNVEAVPVNIAEAGYQLAVVNTGGSHADLTAEYAAIPAEMRRAAAVLGKQQAHGITAAEVLRHAAAIRNAAGDRALLRLLHFAEETQRAEAVAQALRHNRTQELLRLVNASGDSSWRLLQNCYPAGASAQPLPVALETTRLQLDGQGAWRVHGGGFAGTIQVYVPQRLMAGYTKCMEQLFGAGCVIPLDIRGSGLHRLLP